MPFSIKKAFSRLVRSQEKKYDVTEKKVGLWQRIKRIFQSNKFHDRSMPPMTGRYQKLKEDGISDRVIMVNDPNNKINGNADVDDSHRATPRARDEVSDTEFNKTNELFEGIRVTNYAKYRVDQGSVNTLERFINLYFDGYTASIDRDINRSHYRITLNGQILLSEAIKREQLAKAESSPDPQRVNTLFYENLLTQVRQQITPEQDKALSSLACQNIISFLLRYGESVKQTFNETKDPLLDTRVEIFDSTNFPVTWPQKVTYTGPMVDLSPCEALGSAIDKFYDVTIDNDQLLVTVNSLVNLFDINENSPAVLNAYNAKEAPIYKVSLQFMIDTSGQVSIKRLDLQLGHLFNDAFETQQQ